LEHFSEINMHEGQKRIFHKKQKKIHTHCILFEGNASLLY
jgi:hypothetical protein